MFISRECDYAIRIVRSLQSGELRPVNSICEEECIPNQFAYKILKKLENAQIVKGTRGAHGGYQLLASLDQLTLYDVMILIEGPIYINECMDASFDCPRNTEDCPCKVHTLLNSIQNVLNEALQEKTIADILR